MTATAESLNSLGIELKDAGRLAEAEQAYLRAAALDPTWSVPWYNAGLVCKVQRRWADSARYNRRAVELDPDDGDAWWNLGIAATATGDWALARKAWRGCGIDIPEGDGAPRMRYGPIPIRLNPDTSGEVVWCDRIDPARAVIVSVPLTGSGHCEGDTVLHDGAPNGYRMLNGRQLPVFDALQVLERSGRLTLEAWVDAPSPGHVEALVDAAMDAGITVEDWTHTVRMICRQCSEGVPHDEHVPEPAGWDARRHLGIAAGSLAEVGRLLEDWSRGGPERRVLDMASPEA